MNDYVLKPGIFVRDRTFAQDKFWTSVKLVLSINVDVVTCLSYLSICDDWICIEHSIDYLFQFYQPIDKE